MVKGVVDSIQYKILWFPKGDLTKQGIPLTGTVSHQSQEGVDLENNTIQLTVQLEFKYPLSTSSGSYLCHQFCDVGSDGRLKLSTKDILRIFVKYEDGTAIDTSSYDDVLADYFIKSWKIQPQEKRVNITAVDVNYRVFNRLWSSVYGTNDTGTATDISTNVLTDTGKSWTTNQFVNRTLQLEDGSGKQYTYLITANTADTITVHTNISGSVTTGYSVGHSSASAIVNALQQVVNYSSFTGEFHMQIDTTTLYGSSYQRGVQLLRPDGSAFPIIEFATSRSPYYKLLDELSSINAVNTEYELNNVSKVILRDMQYSVQWDTELETYRLNWFYLNAPEKLASGTVSSFTTTTITDTSKSWTTDELKNGLVRLNGKTFQVLSNTDTTLTVSPSVSTSEVQITDNYTIIGSGEYIWDNDKDFKHIYDAQLGNNDDEAFNHIFFSCGTNPLNNREIIGHRLNESSKLDELKQTYIPMTNIVRTLIRDDNRWNSSTGTYDYPSYPYTINAKGAQEVTSNAEYNTELKRLAREQAYRICEVLFSKVKEGFLKGTIQIRGNKFVKAGDASNLNKWYAQGSRIIYKDVKNGIVNPEQTDGYYFLRVTSIKHTVDKTRWITILDVEWDLYDNNEVNTSLGL